MPGEPLTVFASLLSACISDSTEEGKTLAKDGVLVFVLGVFSSALTTYILAQFGILG